MYVSNYIRQPRKLWQFIGVLAICNMMAHFHCIIHSILGGWAAASLDFLLFLPNACTMMIGYDKKAPLKYSREKMKPQFR